jgi:hypothetical protein
VGDDISRGDIVLLRDPQTAGLAEPFARRGAHVVWRSHIGIDGSNELSDSAWQFLRPLLAEAEAYVLTRRSYVPSVVPASRAWIIPPSIDPFSPKNQPMDRGSVRAALAQIGASVGGIQDQVSEGAGVLLADPTDLAAFGRAVRELLDNPELASRMGATAANMCARTTSVTSLCCATPTCWARCWSMSGNWSSDNADRGRYSGGWLGKGS